MKTKTLRSLASAAVRLLRDREIPPPSFPGQVRDGDWLASRVRDRAVDDRFVNTGVAPEIGAILPRRNLIAEKYARYWDVEAKSRSIS